MTNNSTKLEQWAVELACAVQCEVDEIDAAKRIQRAFEDRERKLREALHDAINAPKGVVPASAEAFYDPALCSLREMQTSLPNTVRYLALKETPDAQ